jgi:hypothetical protein
MSQNDFNLANQGFPSMRSDMNSALQALASNSAGATAPATTYPYQWWYDESTDILKVRNAANATWIDFATFDQGAGSWSFTSVSGTTGTFTGDVTLPSINGGPLAGFHNAIINGNFAINQRGVSGTVTLSAGAYGHDRWKAGASGCTYTFATSSNVTTLTISAGSLVQVIEGSNLFSGTYALSFTGTAQGKIGAGSFGASGITGSVTGGTNLSVEFNTGTLAQVQLEAGSVATPFERRPVGTELALCQRYYTKLGGEASNDILIQGAMSTTVSVSATFALPVVMRSTPTGTKVGTWATLAAVQPQIVRASRAMLTLNTTGTSASIVGSSTGTVDTTTYITLDAEL